MRLILTGSWPLASRSSFRYARRRYLNLKAARQIEIDTNATFATRQQTLWGRGTTAVACESTHFTAFGQNIFTEWHSRFGGRGVLIYWHVERGSVVVAFPAVELLGL